jgi:hypothetical protein
MLLLGVSLCFCGRRYYTDLMAPCVIACSAMLTISCGRAVWSVVQGGGVMELQEIARELTRRVWHVTL